MRYLDARIAIAVGWELSALSGSSADSKEHWFNSSSRSKLAKEEFPPLFTMSRDAACSILYLLNGGYSYHVIKKSHCTYAASIDVQGYSVGADGSSEVTALLAAILFAVAKKRESAKETSLLG